MEFTEEEWRGLKQHADERGLMFLSSPFSVEAVELLTRIGVAAWKVASGELTNTPMFERIVATRLPVVLSSGMSPLREIDAAVSAVKAKELPLTVLQCTSLYPCPPDKIGLNVIPRFRERYGCDVGLSDHSGTIYPGLAAATIGIEFLEVHVTLSREMFGPDVPVSVTTAELRQLVDGVRFIEQMKAHPVDKDGFASEMKPLRDLFTKSIVARSDLSKGTVLRREDLTVKKPGTGIPASQISRVVGHTLGRSLIADETLKESDLV
jgi:N-acetylneuraminate synthase